MVKPDFKHLNLVYRLALCFLFLYHGLVPKILWLSDTEIALVRAVGIFDSVELISSLAGIGEILLGLSIIYFRRSLIPVFMAVAILIGLLAYVIFFLPPLLVEAFNPLTTNLLGLVLCYLVISIEKLRLNL